METIKIISKQNSQLLRLKRKKKETKFQKDIFQNIKASRFSLGIQKKYFYKESNLTYIEKNRNKREKKARARKKIYL